MKFAIIGGSGFYDISAEGKSWKITTPYGAAEVDIFRHGTEEIAFLPRHGKDHHLAPHLINYRANIAALKSLGVSKILATSTCGSMNPHLVPGRLALLTQFLDFTWGRASTFSDENSVKHIDMTEPYCPSLRRALLHCVGTAMHPSVTYVCAQGPRFETPAEIEMFRRLGGDLVGMTGVPEVVLAKEAEICYAAVAMVTNRAAGMAGRPLADEDFVEFSKEGVAQVKKAFLEVIANYDETCTCCKLTQ